MKIFKFFKKKKSAFQLIQDKLRLDYLSAQFESDWRLKQEINIRISWLEFSKYDSDIYKELIPIHLRNAIKKEDVQSLKIEQILFPIKFDINDIRHYKFAEKIVYEYGVVLGNPGNYTQCIYRPSSLLPYPKKFITRSLEFNIDYLNNENKIFSTPENKENMLGTLRGGLAYLDNFLDVNEDELPIETVPNLHKGRELMSKK